MKYDKEKTDDSRIAALEKEMKRMGFLIRKIKSWLEVLHGADIDGDNQIDKANDHGRAKVWIVVAICMIAGGAMAANAYLFNLSRSGAAYPFSVGTNNTTYAENLTVSNALIIGGKLLAETNAIDPEDLDVSADVQTVLGSANMATLRQNAGLEIGVDVLAYVQGYSAAITMSSTLETNVLYFNNGILTNWVQNP